MLELPTTVGAVLFRNGTEVASCFRPRGLAHYQNHGVEKCTDIKVSVCEGHTLVVSSCDTQEASTTVQETPTSYNGQVRSAGRSKEARPRNADAKNCVGLDRWRLE